MVELWKTFRSKEYLNYLFIPITHVVNTKIEKLWPSIKPLRRLYKVYAAGCEMN